MKKYLSIVFFILFIIIVIKYFVSDYELNYSLSNHSISIKYNDKRYYIEIDEKYNFDLYFSRGLKKLKIDEIEIIEDVNFMCVVPKIEQKNTYPLCYFNDEYVDFHLINDEKLDKYKKNNAEVDTSFNDSFSFNKNLEKKEFVSLWNYKGFYNMNKNEVKNIEILTEGKYDNSLMYQIENKVLMPNYNEEFLFTSFYIFDIEKETYEHFYMDFEISYDAYIIGNIKNKVYMYDNKNSTLYEINIKTKKVQLIGNEKIGFTKYENSKEIAARKSEYSDRKIEYHDTFLSNYNYRIENDCIYKRFLDNSDLAIKIFEGKNIKVISEHKNNLYFISEDNFYKYNPIIGTIKVFSYFELNFNTNDIIYVYNK